MPLTASVTSLNVTVKGKEEKTSVCLFIPIKKLKGIHLGRVCIVLGLRKANHGFINAVYLQPIMNV